MKSRPLLLCLSLASLLAAAPDGPRGEDIFTTTTTVGVATTAALVIAVPQSRIPVALTVVALGVINGSASSTDSFHQHRRTTVETYIQGHYEALRSEIAAGAGEHLDSVLQLAQVPKAKRTLAITRFKTDYLEIYAPDAQRANVIRSLTSRLLSFRN